MRTVILLSVLLCATIAAPAEDKLKAPDAAAEAPKEIKAAAPELVLEEAAAPDAHYTICPNGWFSHGSRCFMFVNTQKTWFLAEEHCNSLGANLASVTNSREYGFLQQITQMAGQSVAWLGGFNLQGQWLWIDREGFYYTNWYSPSSSSSYPCIYLRTTNGWGNTQCTGAYRFICSKDPFRC